MKKLSMVVTGLIFVLSLTGLSFAQDKAKPDKSGEPAKIAVPAKPPGAAKAGGGKSEIGKKEEAGKPIHYRMGGIVTAIDVSAKKITIKQDQVKRERTVRLRIGNKAAKEISNVQVGDAVNVWVKGNVITTLIKVS
jgi:Cu/Ag efflux protein CusF